jgi:16S rRNA (guanine527-N7)-methyltransferase
LKDAPEIAASEVGASLAAAGLTLDATVVAKLAAFLRLLVRWNRVYNLTGIDDPRELVERHLLESLALGPFLVGERIADVGTGAGLPGLPLAICHPERRFTLIESRRKRVNFLRHVKAALALDNVEVAHARAEDLPTAAPFATVLARAVGPPLELLAVTRHLTATGSVLLLVTSAELAGRIGALADDFVARPLAAPGRVPLRSSIVALERVARPDEKDLR